MYEINVVWLFLALGTGLVIATTAIPMSLTRLSRAVKRTGRGRH